MADDSNRSVRLLCRPKQLNKGSDPGTHFWLVGSPFLPPLTIVSILRCLHTIPSSSSPDLPKESEELRTLIPKGFEVIGALASGDGTGARAAIDATRGLRKLLYGEGIGEDQPLIGAVSGSDSGDLRFFVSESGNAKGLEPVTSIIQEQNPEKCVWENGCLLRCELPIKLPLYYPLKIPLSDGEYDFRSSEVGDGRKTMETMANIATTATKQNNDDVPMRICCRDAWLTLERFLFNYA